jgi:pre-mRNA-processing factor 19
MICSISGKECKEPVVSKEGRVYEKELILQYSKDPISGNEIQKEDLIPIQTYHVSMNTTSIPILLSTLQNEYDAMAVEQFDLRKQVQELQKQLTTSLYETDAAKRVIARLLKERDEARTKLSDFQLAYSQKETLKKDTLQDEGMLDWQSTLDQVAERLSAERRKKPSEYVAPEQLKEYASHVEYKSAGSPKEPGVVALDCWNDLVLGSGYDGSCFHLKDQKSVWSVKAHKQACHVKWIDGERFVSWAESVKIWSVQGKPKCMLTLEHKVHSVCVHPSKDYLVLVQTDGWKMVDLQGNTLVSVDHADLTVGALHPDGLILATSTAQQVILWELKTRSIACTFDHEQVQQMHFSENGYHFGTASDTVHVWDLRKLERVWSTPGSFVSFDPIGKYVVVGATTLQYVDIDIECIWQRNGLWCMNGRFHAVPCVVGVDSSLW